MARWYLFLIAVIGSIVISGCAAGYDLPPYSGSPLASVSPASVLYYSVKDVPESATRIASLDVGVIGGCASIADTSYRLRMAKRQAGSLGANGILIVPRGPSMQFASGDTIIEIADGSATVTTNRRSTGATMSLSGAAFAVDDTALCHGYRAAAIRVSSNR